MIGSWYRSVMQQKADSFKYTRQVIITIIAAAVLVGGFFGYRLYSVYQAKEVHKIFAHAMEEYGKAQANPELWSEVEMAFQVGHEQAGSSNLAPYFKAFQAEALLQQDKLDQAVVIMDEMISALSQESPLHTAYKTKRALMKMDLEDSAMQEAGLQELTEIANDAKALNNDSARYYLGLYHWAQDNVQKAREAWDPLIELQYHEKHAKSPWAQLAQDKLEHTS